MEDWHRENGEDGAHLYGRVERGKAQSPDVAVKVLEPQRLLNLTEVLEEFRTLGKDQELFVLICGEAGGEEIPRSSRAV